jgi:squalene-hopene/tetraprenyl-beta-curcumene cyclase
MKSSLVDRRAFIATLAMASCLAMTPGAIAQEAARAAAAVADVSKDIAAARNKALEYLRTKGQAANGSFSEQAGPAVTALVATAMLRSGLGPDDPTVAKSLKYLEGFIQPDGGIYKGENVRNYETCLSMMALAEANKDGRYAKQLKAAEAYVRGLQWDKGEGIEDSDVRSGGAGYGSKKRPDLSNTQMYLDALKSVGAGSDDAAMQAALKFVSQCQNLESEHNTGTFAAKNPDGGFIYTPVNGGESMAGPLPNGGLRSYGSMTYAGLKSMIYAGLKSDDPRVKAAQKWASANYTLKTNPGMGDAGLYYYLHTMSKALDVIGQDEVVDSKGVKHDWRAEMVAELVQRQKPDGSWTNATPRWMESDPNLVTGYTLLTLANCEKKKSK